MQHTIKSLIGFKMAATDGEIGEVKELYFDDESWVIRYLIVETGNWLFNKKVLIAPQALLAPDWANKNFPVNLTKEQIKSSPDIDTDQPVSHRQEIEMYGHYAWERYGGSGFYAGNSAAVMNLPAIVDEETIKDNDPDSIEDIANGFQQFVDFGKNNLYNISVNTERLLNDEFNREKIIFKISEVFFPII